MTMRIVKKASVVVGFVWVLSSIVKCSSAISL